MAFYDKFPYTNFQELNLDRIIQELMKVKEGLNFVIENASLKYADPIQWNITRQYQANTVVIDPATGIAYISTKPVPDNILITDTGYWTPIFDLSALFESLEDDIGNLENGLAEANTNIAANTTAITNGLAEANEKIDDNTAAIETNTEAIGANTEAIGNNTEHIADINAELLFDVPENVKKHGAIGDGVTDDTAAIQAVLNDYPWAYVPPGTYKITSALEIPEGHTLSGTRKSIINGATAGQTVIEMGKRSTLADIFLTTGQTTGSKLIDMKANSWCTVRNVTGTGGEVAMQCGTARGTVGSDENTCTGAYVTDSTFHDFIGAGAKFLNSNDCYFVNCTFNSGESNQTANDCMLDYNGYTEAHCFVNCEFIGGLRSLLIGKDYVRYCHFTDCMFDSANVALVNGGHDNTFTSCWFSNRGDSGLKVANAYGTKISACSFRNCSPYGLDIQQTAARTLVNGSYFASNETAGISAGGAVGVNIVGNAFSSERLLYEQTKAFQTYPASGVVSANTCHNQNSSAFPTGTSTLNVTNNQFYS